MFAIFSTVNRARGTRRTVVGSGSSSARGGAPDSVTSVDSSRAMTTPPDVTLVVAIALLFRSIPTGMDAALSYLTRTVNPIRLSVPGIIVSEPGQHRRRGGAVERVTPVASVSDAFPLSIDGPDTTVMPRRARRKRLRQVVGHLHVRGRQLRWCSAPRWRS